MPIRTYVVLLLLLFAACKSTPKKKETSKVISLDNFDSFVNKLNVIQTPTAYVRVWDSLMSQYMYNDSSVKFKEIHAARLQAPGDFIAILYNGTTDETEKDIYILASYTKEGKLIQKTTVFETYASNRTNGNDGKIAIESNDMIEVRTFKVDMRAPEEVKYESSAIRYLQVQKDGHHQWQPDYKETFAAFAANFPTLKLPLSYPETPNVKGLQQFRRDNGWYDLKDLLDYDFPKLYKIGKYPIPGSTYTTYLIGVTDVITNEENEGRIDDAIYAVVYDANGREIDRILATGGDGGEDGYYTTWKDFTVDANGVMHMKQKSYAPVLQYMDGVDSFVTRLRTEVTVQKNGRLAVNATNFEMDLNGFSADSIASNSPVADTNFHSYSYLANYPGENVFAFLHYWRLKEDYAFELLTMDKDFRILDAATVAAKFPSGKQPDLHVNVDGKNLYLPAVGKMKATGSVKILLKDQAYTVAADGKLSKITADNSTAAANAVE
ncbi:hypothetical protein ACE38W_21685 [Chitinophaga sp. Hz27]|uniref:hypothetical protein n=1 Tax=Chitinophaga sp. Hz27 TaxID=3347169 RepID=UPI0035E20DD1